MPKVFAPIWECLPGCSNLSCFRGIFLLSPLASPGNRGDSLVHSGAWAARREAQLWALTTALLPQRVCVGSSLQAEGGFCSYLPQVSGGLAQQEDQCLCAPAAAAESQARRMCN